MTPRSQSSCWTKRLAKWSPRSKLNKHAQFAAASSRRERSLEKTRPRRRQRRKRRNRSKFRMAAARRRLLKRSLIPPSTLRTVRTGSRLRGMLVAILIPTSSPALTELITSEKLTRPDRSRMESSLKRRLWLSLDVLRASVVRAKDSSSLIWKPRELKSS